MGEGLMGRKRAKRMFRNSGNPSQFRWILRYLVVIILGFVAWNAVWVEGFNYSDYMVMSALKYPKIQVRSYDWHYIRVELPKGLSTLSMALTTNWVSGKQDPFGLSNDTIPLICIRSGGPPLPDSVVESDLVAAISAGYGHNMSNLGQCTWFRKSMKVNLTNEQISSGILYLGFFNGVGPTRTQSKMINRGSTYTVNVEIMILGCKRSFLGGPFCNNTVNSLTCPQVDLNDHPRKLYEDPLNVREHKQTRDLYSLGKNTSQQLGDMVGNCLFECNEQVEGKKSKRISVSDDRNETGKRSHFSEYSEHELICSNFIGKECIKNGEWKFFAIEVLDISSLLEITVEYENFNFTVSETLSGPNDTINQTDVEATIYVRHNSLPQETSYEYSLSVGQSSLPIQFPKLGWWYIGAHFSNLSKTHKSEEEKNDTPLCFLLKWRIYVCSFGKTGDDCRWNVSTLKRVKKVGANLQFESRYLPVNQEESAKSESFPLDPFFSNSSVVGTNQDEWSFLLFEVPHGAAGGVVSVELGSYSAMTFDMYARFGSIPTLQVWDYHTNVSQASETSMLSTSKDANKKTKMHLNIIYPQEGIWCLGLKRHSGRNLKLDGHEVTMSISLQGCPNHCSKHGTCHTTYEESGLTSFSFCHCDRTHGGFDCSVELISPKGQRGQAAALIVSNIAAILPGLWSIRHKAYAEWILYTASGISSALYHSCDVGSWCALSFHVLQFMDFWLSFMAVVATFVYVASMDDKTKVAVHTSGAIITALVAVNGPTRSINIIIVVTIGIVGLLFGWIVEFLRSDQISKCCSYFNSDNHLRWQVLKTGPQKLFKKLDERFRWSFVGMGFLALGAAGLSWHLESVQTYWIWHSLWHVSIYTSSFLFLCSIIPTIETSNDPIHYEPISHDNLNNSRDYSRRQTELNNSEAGA